jgi:hypothetical protein
MHSSMWRREETRPVGPARAERSRRLSPTLRGVGCSGAIDVVGGVSVWLVGVGRCERRFASSSRVLAGVFPGSGERAVSAGGLAGLLVAAVCVQVSSGSARMRASALVKSCCQGQRAGR